jgi:pyruvate dehydrogenase (quinone)
MQRFTVTVKSNGSMYGTKRLQHLQQGAEAQLNGLACCAGSSGPGHVHLINGLYDAHHSSASVLAIASTIPTKEFGTGYFQETNTIKLFDDLSCYNQIADDS